MTEERTLSDADCEKIAELLVPKLKSSILGDVRTEAGKGILSLAWKAALIIGLWLALYSVTGKFTFPPFQAEAVGPPVKTKPAVEFRVLPPAKDNPRLTELAEALDRKIGRGG